MHPWWSSKIGLLTIQPAIFLMAIAMVTYPYTAGEAFGARGTFFGLLFLANGVYVFWLVFSIFKKYASDLPDDPEPSSDPIYQAHTSEPRLQHQPPKLGAASEVKRLREK